MPSDINLIAERYVRALFDLASEGKQHDSVKKDMLLIKSMLSESAELRRLLVNPLITRASAEKAVHALLTTIKASDLTKKFFTTLAGQRRLALMPVTIDKYLSQLAESRGELAVEVTSAGRLGAEQLKLLTQALARATGKTIHIEARENPALIGGVQVKIGGKMLDNTIASKLARLRIALTKAA